MAVGEIEPFPGHELTEEMQAAVSVEEHFAPGPEGAPAVRVLVYRPRRAEVARPLVVSIHGGAVGMRADMFPAMDARLAMLGARVVSIDYRIVPDHVYPCGVEDCYAALCWAVDTLDIDPARVVITGASAGGALAAAVALMARDRNGPAISLQALVIPVLDDRCATPSMSQYVEAPLFGGRQANEMWDVYLGPDVDRGDTPAYAAPNRADDLRGLPPAFIQVGGLDPLRDEGILYAMRLLAADVPVELYCTVGEHHGVPEDPRTSAHSSMLYQDAIRSVIG
jgi:acetyl esterase